MTTAVRVEDMPYHVGLVVGDYEIGTVDYVDVEDADVDSVFQAAEQLGVRLVQNPEETPPDEAPETDKETEETTQ
jgi:hypothetical protein